MENNKRLIDANALQRKLVELGAEPDYQHSGEDWGVGVCMAEGIVDEMPTVDAVEVVHGHWVSLTDCANAGVYCSVCNKKVYKEDYAWCNRKNKLRSNYCPNCGAKMDGDGNV